MKANDKTIKPDEIKSILVVNTASRVVDTFTDPVSLLTAVHQLDQEDHRTIRRIVDNAKRKGGSNGRGK